jgi:prepilin signal peptidase PulO-like enzyme (type II secretory pathway)
MDVHLTDLLWFRLLAGLTIGLVLGSFTTMLSYRIPRHISIITPPSQCPKCHTPLKTIDLIPVFSWLFERGKCRYCQSPISVRYLLIELSTAAAVTAAFLAFGFKPHLIVALIGIVAFITMVTINIERNKDI